ncbi:MAG: hypothetical protein RR202_00665 [Bacteroidales bacterium]
MDALKFVKACQEQNPIDLYDVALGVFTNDLPDELFDNYDVMMTIELLTETLYEEKEFEKVEQLVQVLRCNQPELYQEGAFTLLPNLICYSLFKGDTERVEFYMMELSIAPEEDILLFAHLLDVIDAYGYTELMNKIVTHVLNSDHHLDEEDVEVLESYLMSVDANTEDRQLIAIRRGFLDRAPVWHIPEITAENIIDAMIEYFDHNFKENLQEKLLLEEVSFRNYIAGMIDSEYLDTYEYAATVLWGSVYLMDQLGANGVLTAEETAYNLEIIRKVKAFLMVNIPWDGYWKLKFLYTWDRPYSIEASEFEAEKQLVEHNLQVKPNQIVNESILDIFGKYAKNISYSKYLEDEQAAFEKMISEENKEEFGVDKKTDSMFPYFNYLSGEFDSEFKPKPSGKHT